MFLLKKYKLSISWLTLLLILTLSPGSNIPTISITGIDKMVHLFLFFVFVILITIEKNKGNTSKLIDKRSPIIISLATGIIIECIQIYIPQRSFSLWDVVANFSGIMLGILFLTFLNKKQNS